MSARTFHLLVCATLVMLVSLVYAQACNHDFVQYDDPIYITENAVVQKGLSAEGLRWAFVHGGDANYWTPMTWLSHMLDVELFGAGAASAGGHHLVSVALHAIDAIALYFVLIALTQTRRPAAFVAAIWAAHPLHVESVAWIAERKDVLSALFFFLTIWAYARHSRRPCAGSYTLVLALFLLALMAKPMVMTLPAVLLLLDVWPLKRAASWRRLALEKAPMVLLAAACGVVTLLAQRQAGAVRSLEQFPLAFRASNALVSIGRYLAKTLWPTEMTVFYPPPARWSSAAVVASAGLVVAITLLALAQRRARPYLLVGWLWFCGMLLPVIGLLQVGRQAMADRYTYLPHVGLFIAVAWLGAELATRSKAARIVVAIAAATCVFVSAMVAHSQVQHWRSTQTLFVHAMQVSVDNDVALNQLGSVLARQGKLAEAERFYREAIRIDPAYAMAHTNLGNVLVRQRRFSEAIGHYRAALAGAQQEPVKIYFGLGLALNGEGQFAQSDRAFTAALRINPRSAQIHVAWGRCFLERGDIAGARKQSQAALATDPALADAARLLNSLPATKSTTAPATK